MLMCARKSKSLKTDVCKIFFSVLMGLLTLGFLRLTQYFRNKKTPPKQNKNVCEAYSPLSHLVNGLLVFLSEFSGKPF